MNGKQVGENIVQAVGIVKDLNNVRAGGNLGMVFIAAAIEEHALAVRQLAEAIRDSLTVTVERINEDK
jgi:hypothetical protein